VSLTAAQRWEQTRTFHHSAYPPERIAALRAEQGASVSVCLPARECAVTVAEIVTALLGLREQGVLDEVVVIDANSRDGTAQRAAAAGATVYQEAQLRPELGPVLGKGDALWRALGVLRGELVCFIDADTIDFDAHFATGLLGPLVCEPGVSFVKAFYRRPFVHGGVSVPEGGGRVNHLLARPALELFYPALAGVRQPLAGEVGARRELLERIPFTTGYGVEVAMLLDVWDLVGGGGVAQVDLGVHRNSHQALSALAPMARTVLATIAARAQREGRLQGVQLPQSVIERPPLAQMVAG
jgi:glucosyl-3-phosphoglycerate synthase